MSGVYDLIKGSGGYDEVYAHDQFNLLTNPGEDAVFGGYSDDDMTRAQDGFKVTIACAEGSWKRA